LKRKYYKDWKRRTWQLGWLVRCTCQHVGRGHYTLTMHVTFSGGFLSLFADVLKLPWWDLSSGGDTCKMHGYNEALTVFFSSLSFLSYFFENYVGLPKLKDVMSFCFCIKFDFHSFNCYLFYFVIFLIDFYFYFLPSTFCFI